ncbi:MAG: dipeptide epimerase [Paludibacteraceae bacterium]|nr:dipeptide epimerase [Paludibacteraceae bacterium]
MNRRNFLKKSVLYGSAAVFAPSLLSSCAEKNSRHPDIRHNSHKGKMSLSYFSYDLQLRHTFTVSGYSRNTTPDVQVRIDYEGYTGHGEASLPPYLGYTVEGTMSFLERVDLSQFASPFLLEDILSYVDGLADGETPAKAAIDIALHDLIGQLTAQPLYALLGLNPEKVLDTCYTIGIDTPEVVRAKTLECAGLFNVLKVKVGYDGDEEMVRTIREVTDLPLVVDANQGWHDRSEALEKICWLSEQGVRMIEQPMPKESLDDIAWLTQHSPLPVFADESVQRLSDIRSLRGAYTGINIKLMKSTGIREALKMINYARAEGMQVMLGCMTETSCAVTAAASLSPLVDFADLDGNLLISNDLYEGVGLCDGRLCLPNRPGLGLIGLS